MRISHAKTAVLLTLCIALVHLLIAPSVDLSVDEAHYGLYARFLDLSYFDHPPLVGWLLWLLSPLGLNEFTLRLPSAAIYIICCLLLYRISVSDRSTHSELQGLVAVGLFSLTPMVQLLGFGLVPEFPLLMWSLLIASAVIKQEGGTLKFWLYLGLLFGLAGLTKYTAILLVPGLALYWLLQGQLPGILKSGQFYAGMLLAALLISPVLIWNMQNDWASFRYQLNHTAGGEWELVEVAKAFGVQILSYSLVLVIGGLIALRKIARPGRQGVLACMALPVIAFITISSGNGASLPHWSLLAWALLTPEISRWLIEGWQQRSIRWLGIVSSILALCLSATLLFLLAFKPLGSAPWMAPAMRDLVGWRSAAITAQELLARHPAGTPLLVNNWSRASRIAWYAWPTPVQVLDPRPGQFAYWYGAVSSGSEGILIRDNLDADDQPMADYRKMGLSCKYIDQLMVDVDGVALNQFYFYSCLPDAAPERL